MLSGKIAKMNLAQLDMYLKEKVGMTPRRSKAKVSQTIKSGFYYKTCTETE